MRMVPGMCVDQGDPPGVDTAPFGIAGCFVVRLLNAVLAYEALNYTIQNA